MLLALSGAAAAAEAGGTAPADLGGSPPLRGAVPPLPRRSALTPLGGPEPADAPEPPRARPGGSAGASPLPRVEGSRCPLPAPHTPGSVQLNPVSGK